MRASFHRAQRVHYPRFIHLGKAQALCWEGDPKHGATIPAQGWDRDPAKVTCHKCQNILKARKAA